MIQDKPISRVKRQTGFSLLEMLVALAVFAIAALALIKLQAASLWQTSELDSRLYSEIVVKNLAVDLMTDPRPPALGDDRGDIQNAGRQFAWRTTTAAADESMVRIDITVTQGNGPELTLTIYRPVA